MAEKKKSWNVSAEIRAEQKAALANMTRKEKFKYYWEYYRYHVIISIIVIASLSHIIYGIVTNRDFSFYAVIINSHGLDGEALSEEFSVLADLDNEKLHCFIDTTLFINTNEFSQTDSMLVQRLFATVGTGELDTIVADAFTFIHFANAEFFIDLRLVLSDDEIEYYKDIFFYVDRAAIEARRTNFNIDIVHEIKTPEQMKQDVELRRQPEIMTEPVPVGIFLSDSLILKDAYWGDTVPVIGITVSSSRKDKVLELIEFLGSRD